MAPVHTLPGELLEAICVEATLDPAFDGLELDDQFMSPLHARAVSHLTSLMLVDKRWYGAAKTITYRFSFGAFSTISRVIKAVAAEPALAAEIQWLLFGDQWGNRLDDGDAAGLRELLPKLAALRYVELSVDEDDVAGGRGGVAGGLSGLSGLRHIVLISAPTRPSAFSMIFAEGPPVPTRGSSTMRALSVAIESCAANLRSLRLEQFRADPAAERVACPSLPSLRELHVHRIDRGGQLALPGLIALAPRVELLHVSLGGIDGEELVHMLALITALLEVIPPTVRALGLQTTSGYADMCKGVLDPIVKHAQGRLRALYIDNPPLVSHDAILLNADLRELHLRLSDPLDLPYLEPPTSSLNGLARLRRIVLYREPDTTDYNSQLIVRRHRAPLMWLTTAQTTYIGNFDGVIEETEQYEVDLLAWRAALDAR